MTPARNNNNNNNNLINKYLSTNRNFINNSTYSKSYFLNELGFKTMTNEMKNYCELTKDLMKIRKNIKKN